MWSRLAQSVQPESLSWAHEFGAHTSSRVYLKKKKQKKPKKVRGPCVLVFFRGADRSGFHSRDQPAAWGCSNLSQDVVKGSETFRGLTTRSGDVMRQWQVRTQLSFIFLWESQKRLPLKILPFLPTEEAGHWEPLTCTCFIFQYSFQISTVLFGRQKTLNI